MTTVTASGRTLILASASPRRRELLSGLGFELLVDPNTTPEPARKPGEPAASYVVRAARGKAREVAARHASGLIIAADTIVLAKNQILGKPAVRAEARRMLENLSGRWHDVFTGICLIDLVSGRSGSAHSRSRVHFRSLAKKEIEWYLATGEYQDKAGAYAIQGYASLFVDRIEGCYFNIVGFPIFTFALLCRRLGIEIH
jgi:septum formation protein